MNSILTLFISLTASTIKAQISPATQPALWKDPFLILYIMGALLIIVALIVVGVALYMLKVLRLMADQAAVDKLNRTGIAPTVEPGLWQKFMQWATGLLPVEKEQTIMLDHNYDGIKELDNHLPPWWKWLLYGSMIWSVFYMFAYHVSGSLPLSIQEYEQEVASANKQIQNLQAANPQKKIDETTVVFTTDAVALKDGEDTFKSICASCHRVDGGGDIGPNLTDAYWKHGGSIQDVFKVVTNGVPNTNMVAWGASMSPEKIQNVSSYLLTLQGTNPPNAKAAEGELYQEKPSTEPKPVSAL